VLTDNSFADATLPQVFIFAMAPNADKSERPQMPPIRSHGSDFSVPHKDRLMWYGAGAFLRL